MFNSSKCPQNISMTFNYCKTGGICMEGDSFSISKIIKILTGCIDLWTAAGNAFPKTVLEHSPNPWQGLHRPRALLDLHLSNLTSFHSTPWPTVPKPLWSSFRLLKTPSSWPSPMCSICLECSSLSCTYSYSAFTPQMSSPQRNLPSPPAPLLPSYHHLAILFYFLHSTDNLWKLLCMCLHVYFLSSTRT